MTNIERISYYESLLNKGIEIIKNYPNNFEAFINFETRYHELNHYFMSEERKQDIEDDENNKLPNDLCRGVLGEDYLYNFLCDYEEILNEIKK